MSRVTTNCPSCVKAGQQGSCARLRCYCGHSECWAFDSYYKPAATVITAAPKADERMAKSWAEREEPTWLDR